MAEALISGATDTGNINSKRAKRDVAGGPKGGMTSITVPISSRSKKKKGKKEKHGIE